MSGRSGFICKDEGRVRIKRAGALGWESREMAQDGIVLRGHVLVRVISPMIVTASEAVRDIYRERIAPGRPLKVNRAMFRDLQFRGLLREIIEGPTLHWAWSGHNLVVDVGVDYALDAALSGGTAISAWFVGLTDDTPVPAAGDTMASHGGWVTFTEYSNATNPAYVDGGVTAGSMDNSASTADFSIDNDTNGGLGGIFLTDSNTKGGSTGQLYSVVVITGGNRVVNNGDTVEATYTFTAADDAV